MTRAVATCSRLLDNWSTFRPRCFFSVPRVHALLVGECKANKQAQQAVFGGRLRFVFTAGAPLPAQVESAYHERNIPVLEGWGLTETSPCVTVTTKDAGWRSGYVGQPIPGVSVRIEGDQEILVKGPNVMEGYLDDEEATGHVLNRDGWFHTGDIGEFTKNGLRILGRKDGAFKLTNGEKVHPFRIENLLVNESPYLSLALVLGSGKDYVAALLYPNMAALRIWAADHDVPIDGLTRDPRVRELYAAELERINAAIEVKYHRIRRAILMDAEPTLARGELTPSGKLVRSTVLNNGRHQTEALFAEKPSVNVIVAAQVESERMAANVA